MVFLPIACRTYLPSLCLPSICPLLLFLPGWVKATTQPKKSPVQRRAVTAQRGTHRAAFGWKNPQIWPENAKPSHSISWRGLPTPPTNCVTPVSLLLPAAATAVYKQWIPNTNFETASNWDEGRVPCASDVVHFEKNKVLNISILFLFFYCLILFVFYFISFIFILCSFLFLFYFLHNAIGHRKSPLPAGGKRVFTFAFLTGCLSLRQVSPRADRHGKAACGGAGTEGRAGARWHVPVSPSPGTLTFCSVVQPG